MWQSFFKYSGSFFNDFKSPMVGYVSSLYVPLVDMSTAADSLPSVFLLRLYCQHPCTPKKFVMKEKNSFLILFCFYLIRIICVDCNI